MAKDRPDSSKKQMAKGTGKGSPGPKPRAKPSSNPKDLQEEGEGPGHDDDQDIEEKVDKEAEEYKKRLTTSSKGAFTPTTMLRKRPATVKRTWKPMAAGGILIGMALIGLITSSNLVMTAYDSPLYSPDDGSLKGFVLNEDGERLVGAYVQIKGKSIAQQTDDNGKFKFKDVPKGEREIVASYPGYTTVNFPTMVLGGTQLSGIGNTNLTLPKATVTLVDLTSGNWTVIGTVRDNNRNPEANATVKDLVTGKNVTTKADGSFSLGLLPVGQREITVTKASFNTRTVRFFVTEGRGPLEVLLSPGTGTDTEDLTTGNVTVTGQVTPPPKGSDVSMVEVNDVAFLTGSDGRFSIIVQAGLVSMTASTTGSGSTTVQSYIDAEGGHQDISVLQGTTKTLEGDRDALRSNLSICGSVILIMSIFIMFTGVTAIKRRRFWVAVTGALFGAVFMLVTFQYGIILALIAFGLLLFSRREFE